MSQHDQHQREGESRGQEEEKEEEEEEEEEEIPFEHHLALPRPHQQPFIISRVLVVRSAPPIPTAKLRMPCCAVSCCAL